jgi:hypothetical protein
MARLLPAEIITMTNGIEIEVRAASFRNVRGVTAVAVVGDEVAFWYSDDSASTNPDTAILDALRPALATTNGMLAVISSPYARRGAVYETWRLGGARPRRRPSQARCSAGPAPGAERVDGREHSLLLRLQAFHDQRLQRDRATVGAGVLVALFVPPLVFAPVPQP